MFGSVADGSYRWEWSRGGADVLVQNEVRQWSTSDSGIGRCHVDERSFYVDKMKQIVSRRLYNVNFTSSKYQTWPLGSNKDEGKTERLR